MLVGAPQCDCACKRKEGEGRGGGGDGERRGRGGGWGGTEEEYILHTVSGLTSYTWFTAHPGLSRDVQQEKTGWYEVGPRTIVVTKVDDGIVWVLGHALEGAEVRSMFGHGLPNRSVQVA